MMDIEKLIEDLRGLLKQWKNKNDCRMGRNNRNTPGHNPT